ncbi:beta-propeller domain-containing protein [Micromonospora sp. WMMD812]|uniref:beta-propeller domain-containing protein n=1 Tax=Micromonospora sp. WMMD812 TaxID=3015152 RepID=UPI00248BCF05|nr:beta-propeller domain-containing protein [Micromonospora sp. WMMD812]WBB65835.1 beta-propeller domain-containing protein [Micromonospora sp. WMMD812]
MTRGLPIAAAATLAALTLLAGSGLPPATGPAPAAPDTTAAPAAQWAEPARLVSYTSCDEALAGLRAATAAEVGPWGFGDGWRTGVALPKDLAGEREATATTATPEHSTTNVHEAGADEPDLVKTDGRRIVTVTEGVLRVVDPATRRTTGRLDLTEIGSPDRYAERSLLLLGDRALVLTGTGNMLPALTKDRPRADGAQLTLIDLAGAPVVLGTYRIDGSLVDARQTGTTARVVVRSHPQFVFPYDEKATDAERTAANRAVVAAAGIEAWLPAYEWTAGERRHAGRLGCDRLSRPDDAIGTSVLTLLSFDLTADRLGDGDPVGVAADATTVYGTAANLWLAGGLTAGRAGPIWEGRPAGRATTVIHQFDLTAPGRPRYLASGTVPGSLINQYALSEWQGRLRVATTLGETWGRGRDSESGVYVLGRRDGTLEQVGAVTGLGRGERIYSVRFLGATGHVVTFRQTDPLYTLDLTDPTAPRVTGELKITGYSAYLHPLPFGRLLGVGQEADNRGRVRGLQVSLFDVRDPARPLRLHRYHVPGASSAVEFDPHAFLHQPETGLVALPVDAGVRLLRVTAARITEIGTVNHPGDGAAPVTRSLLVGDTLWTVSDAGLRASDAATARNLAWLPST